MFAFDVAKYQRWQTFPRVARFWIKAWIDGLHVGTHVHWLLSPLSVMGLANIWRSLPDDHHYSPQRQAIAAMASRRRSVDLYVGPMPDPEAPEPMWSGFFQRQLDG